MTQITKRAQTEGFLTLLARQCKSDICKHVVMCTLKTGPIRAVEIPFAFLCEFRVGTLKGVRQYDEIIGSKADESSDCWLARILWSKVSAIFSRSQRVEIEGLI